MKLILDRSQCSQQQTDCEFCFGNHLVHADFSAADCLLEVYDNERPELFFKIYDRDHGIKTLIVTDENKSAALASWFSLWEAQSGPVI